MKNQGNMTPLKEHHNVPIMNHEKKMKIYELQDSSKNHFNKAQQTTKKHKKLNEIIKTIYEQRIISTKRNH